MLSIEKFDQDAGLTPEMIEYQLALLMSHTSLRSSKRLIGFLRYVVDQTLIGSADKLKERTIGIEVFQRDPDYDTSSDHIVRTAASELRKRLAVYYGDDEHRTELRIDIPQGSYVPRFTLPQAASAPEKLTLEIGSCHSPEAQISFDNEPARRRHKRTWFVTLAVLGTIAVVLVFISLRRIETPRSRFWNPVIRHSDSVLLVVGNVSSSASQATYEGNAVTPSPPRNADFGFPSVAVGDAIAMSQIANVFATERKGIVIRQESEVSFDDLRTKPSVLIGLFNNAWSLRFAHPLRFSLALDANRQLLYIRDRTNPTSRAWSVAATDRISSADARASGKAIPDYALITRIVNSETGKPMVIAGGLYMYGTEAAGEFLSDQHLDGLAATMPLGHDQQILQIVLETSVTEGVPGPPKVLAYSSE